MKNFLSNKKFVIAVCLISFIVSGLIISRQVFGVSVTSNMDMGYGKIINLGTPTYDDDAATKDYVDSAFSSFTLPWSKLTGFPSSCSSGQYVSAVGSSLTCSTPSSSWTTSGSKIYNSNTGYVGIGNSSPSYKLDVSGTINASNALCIAGTCKNTWNDPWSNLTNFPSSCSSGQYVSGVGSSLTCSTPSSSWTTSGSNIYNSNTGYVGIGNSSPSYKLDVSGTINASNAICIAGSCKNGWDSSVWTKSGSSIYSNNSGNVGIGTSNPSFKLDVNGDARINSLIYVSSNYVGIGNSNPGYKLDVNGSINASSYYFNGSSMPIWRAFGTQAYYDGNVAVGFGTLPDPSYSLKVGGDLYAKGRIITSSNLITTTGNLGVGNTAPSYTLDVSGQSRLNGNVGIGTSPSYSYRLDVSGNVNISGDLNISGTANSNVKNFVIDHPLDPQNKQLVHSTLEGPEIAVFYRGEAQLQNGKAIVELPSYFEALTRKDVRTVLLTPKFDNNEPVSNLAASAVTDGKFQVRAVDENNPNQKFYWEVKAIRADVAPLEVEKIKTEAEK